MTTTTQHPTTVDRRRRRIGWAGPAAGVVGALATMMSSTAVARGDRRSDPAAAVGEAFDGLAPVLKASSALGLVGVALVVVFVAELRARLDAAEPEGSTVPGLAWAGGVMAGAALSVAFIVTAVAGTLVDEGYRDTTLEVFGALADNLAFAAWAPLGLTMAAVAVGGLRRNAVPRWLGIVSAGTTAVLVAALLSGLPFAAWVLACAWLVAAGVDTARHG